MSKNGIVSFLKDNWILLLVIIYIFFPLDLIPDVVPIFGKVDDAILLLFELIREYIKYKRKDEKE